VKSVSRFYELQTCDVLLTGVSGLSGRFESGLENSTYSLGLRKKAMQTKVEQNARQQIWACFK